MSFTNAQINQNIGIPPHYIKVTGPNGVPIWVPPTSGALLGIERHLGDPLPETQRSFDVESEIRALCKTVREQAEEMQAQYRMIEKLRSEMDQLHALIKENHSRQVNGAGYWEPA